MRPPYSRKKTSKRVLHSGSASASQAESEGSIPSTRSFAKTALHQQSIGAEPFFLPILLQNMGIINVVLCWISVVRGAMYEAINPNR